MDKQIIKGCRKQQAECQHQLYNLSVSRLYNVIYRILGNHHDTEDVLQESYIKIFKKIGQYNPSKGTIFPWLNRICINTAINYLKRKRFSFDDISQLSIADESCDLRIDHMDAEYILEIIQKLPEQARVIFNLYEIEGYSHKEIADMLEINPNSCRVHLSRAKIKLQTMINEYNLFNRSIHST